MNPKNIPPIMKILSKKYISTSNTTLNRMRKKPNPYKVLIACLLSLRARDENTEKVSKKLFAIADTPEKIIKIPIKKLEKIIFSSGHYKKKAAAIKHVTGELIGRFKGKVPKTREELLSIKGIGPKTANIVLAFAYGQVVIPVDVHAHVCANRFGWIKTKNAEKSEIELHKVMPKRYWTNLNAILVQFGREICDTRSPKCSKCPIKKYCPKIGVKRSR